MKKPNVTYAEIYVRDLLIERDSAAFYRNLITRLAVDADHTYRPLLREWAKLNDEWEQASASGWLPDGDESAGFDAGEARMSPWVAFSAALAAEGKAKLYYEGVKKRSTDPHALALAEKRVGERNERIERLQAMIAAASRPQEIETVEQPNADRWLQQRVAALGGFRFVHSEVAV